jgi:hypothetical protein
MQVFTKPSYIKFKDDLKKVEGFILAMQPQGNFSYSYNAAQAFNSAYAFGAIGRMAAQNNVVMGASTPGLPSDSFRRSYNFTSNRFLQPIDETKKFFKDVGSMLSSIGFISKIVAYFYPPAAAVSVVTEIAAPVMTLAAGDMTPKPVVFYSQQKYNPWIR